MKDEEHDAAAVPAPAPPVDKDQPMSVDDFEEDESKALEELRILVKVRVHSCCDSGGDADWIVCAAGHHRWLGEAGRPV